MTTADQTSKPVSNLIQGVSQQADEQRRDSQCEAQYDCMNTPKDGAVARHGADLIQSYTGLDWSGAFAYSLERTQGERYLVLIKNSAIKVINRASGVDCTVNVDSNALAYLAVAGDARNTFLAQTVNDYTFIGNKEVIPVIQSGVGTAARPKEALIFFKAGAYLAKFRVAVNYLGQTYSFSYTTPDNSAASNAKYIDTGQLAATFYRAMTGLDAAAYVYAGAAGMYPGDTGGNGAGTPSVVSSTATLTSLGFDVSINGNLLMIARNADGNDFSVDVSDSAGSNYLSAFKDYCRSFTDLPRNGFNGFTLKVRGQSQDQSDDYYVAYNSGVSGNGSWAEVCAPNTPTTLDPASMPHALVNTAFNTFRLMRNTWSTRIAGDAVTSKNPSFVGQPIQELYYDRKRFGILTEGSGVWSKSLNPFTFFKDTVQTVLATDPIDINITAKQSIALLRKVVTIDEALFIWAQRAQFRVNSGQDPLKQDTIEAPVTSSYEFSETCNFESIGTTLYFATEADGFVIMRAIGFLNGRMQGDTDITAHVSEYVPNGARHISSSDTLRTLFVRTEGDPASLYVYNFLLQGTEYVQSAWNKWRLPVGTIVWSNVYSAVLELAVMRGGVLWLLNVPLRNGRVDDEAGSTYRTRMDYRITEDGLVQASTFDPVLKQTTLYLPYFFEADAEGPAFKVVQRVSAVNGNPRGLVYPVVAASGSVVVVEGDATGQQLYLGFGISSERKESTFYIRTAQGVIPTDRLQVREFAVSFAKSCYTRLQVTQRNGKVRTSEFSGTVFRTDAGNIGLAPVPSKGKVKIAVDSVNEFCDISMINDSPFPSRWQTAEWVYQATIRVTAGGVGGGPAKE